MQPAFRLTRIAPTPSGYLHIGNILSFAITAALARQTGARILLRIDDMDRERLEKKYIADIFSTLAFLGIEWQEGPRDEVQYAQGYSQAHRLPLYAAALQQLRQQGALFACTCSRAAISRAGGVYPGTCRHRQLPFDAPDTCWRLITDDAGMLRVNTLNGPVTAPLPDTMHSFIVRRKDGFPAYQLASLVDDVHFGTDLIVRGEDLWPSTLAQQYLAQVSGANTFTQATFHHHTLVNGPDGQKLSKSAGKGALQTLRDIYGTPGTVYARIAQLAGIHAPIPDWSGLVNAISAHGWHDVTP